MTTCYNCGQPISIRYVAGRKITIHPNGGCNRDTPRGFYTPVDARSQFDGGCRPTTCPRCPAKIFFVKHNGGSVWLDPPLGPPWYIHECMDKRGVSSGRGKLSLVDSSFLKGKQLRRDHTLGIVIAFEPGTTELNVLEIDIGTGKTLMLLMARHIASFLLGHMVVYDPKKRTLTALENEFHVFAVVAAIPMDDSKPMTDEILPCKDCGAPVNLCDLAEHLRIHHGFEVSRRTDTDFGA